MRSLKRQNGAGLWSYFFGLGLLGFVVFTVLKLVPVYLDDFAIESAVQGLQADTGKEYRGALSVRTALLKRFDINNVKNVRPDDISIVRDGQYYNVDVTYEMKVPYVANISLVIYFSHHATVRASV